MYIRNKETIHNTDHYEAIGWQKRDCEGCEKGVYILILGSHDKTHGGFTHVLLKECESKEEAMAALDKIQTSLEEGKKLLVI